MKTFALVLSLAASALARDLSHTATNRTTRLFKEDPRFVDQFADCYENSNQGGQRLHIDDYYSDLSLYNFNNRISSCCFTGIWLLYADANYNAYNTAAHNMWAFGDNHCMNVYSGFERTASSARYTGITDAWTEDSLNLYYNEYFIGGEEYSLVDIPQTTNNDGTKSIIVTGHTDWTIYANRNYSGNCKCVSPADKIKGTPGFYSTESSLGYMARSISSARKGCFCSIREAPENMVLKSDENGASGFF